MAISWCLPDENNAYADAVLILLSADTEAFIKALLIDNIEQNKSAWLGIFEKVKDRG